MEHKIVGKVVDLRLSAQGNVASILVKREVDSRSPVVLGMFLLLVDKTTDGKEGFLCVAEEHQPDLPPNVNFKESIRDSMDTEKEVDSYYKKQLVYMGFKCRLLGVCKTDELNNIKYYSNVRSTPIMTNLVATLPSPSFLKKVLEDAVTENDNEDFKPVIFDIGYLKYGTNPDDTDYYRPGGPNEVPVKFNASNLLRKKTAIFGKSGYGKSNTVKVVIGMLAKEQPNCSMLILDTNGEYARNNSQNDGFMDIFHEAGMKDKCVLYTNRKMLPGIKIKYGDSIKPLKFDVYNNIRPSFEIVEANLEMNGEKEPMYLTAWLSAIMNEDDSKKYFNNFPNPGLIYGIYYQCLIQAGIKASNPQHTNGPYLKVSKDYLNWLAQDRPAKKTKKEKEQEAQEEEASDASGAEGDSKKTPVKKVMNFSELSTERQTEILHKYNIKVDGNRHVCSFITTMADYAVWYLNHQMNDESSIKGFTELLKYSRRLYALNYFNVRDEQSNFAQSLGDMIFEDLKKNRIVMLDLASVGIKIAKSLSRHIMSHLLAKASAMFGDDAQRTLFDRFDTVVFIEEAQNYLSKEELTSKNPIYERLAKEGRKFHLGLVYITQQPSAIDNSITSQTENIIALHMSNDRDCRILNEIKDKFDPLTCKFLKDESAKGLCYLYAEPHQPFVLPCQIKPFNAELILGRKSGKK